MSNTEDQKQKEYMDFLGKGIEENNLYRENTRPNILVDEHYKTIHSLRMEALQNISLDNFNKLLEDKKNFKNNYNYGKCITEYKDYHKENKNKVIIPESTTFLSNAVDQVYNVGSALGSAGTGIAKGLGFKGGRKSLKIKRSARHKKSHSKSIKRRKRSKK